MRTGDYKQTYGELVALVDSPPVGLWSVVLLLALVVAPYALNAYALSFVTIILISVVGTLGLNILTGYTGLISLGHVGFLVTGAYAYAVLGSGVGGLLIGITENLAGGYLGSGMKEVAGFLMIILVLMIRPFGIFGERDIERV